MTVIERRRYMNLLVIKKIYRTKRKKLPKRIYQNFDVKKVFTIIINSTSVQPDRYSV